MGVKQVLVRPRYDDDDDDDEAADQSPSPPPMSSCGRYLLHRVCRFDTLAGVAIKYGVEVADVKRANGLTTDLQMFAHKTLRVPLHGRHAPSPPSSSPSHADRAAREWTARRPPKIAASLDPFLKPPRSTVSPSKSLLQGYYGLTPTPKGNLTNEGTEMATYAKGHHRKARSLSSNFSLENGDGAREMDDAEKPIRRRQKTDGELTAREDNGGSLLARSGQGLALRPKCGSRPDMNGSQQDLLATWVPSYGDGLHTVKKSSSTPEFQDSDSISIASVWLKSKWNLKPDAFTLTLRYDIVSPAVGRLLQASLRQHPEASPRQHSELDSCLEKQGGQRLARLIASFLQPYTYCLFLGNLVQLPEQGPGEVGLHFTSPSPQPKRRHEWLDTVNRHSAEMA